jgi:ABC-type antimicrobial peptide transport system permease subunit
VDLAAGIRIALRALPRHKMQSVLAMLGISIGVGAFVCSVAVGEGASNQIEARSRNVNGVRTGTYGTKSLTLGDARAIEQQIDLVVNVSPHVNRRVQVVYRGQNWQTMVRGVSPEYMRVRRWRLARGVIFSHDDVEFAAKVCVLGQTVVASLFGEDDPIGETIRVQNIPRHPADVAQAGAVSQRTMTLLLASIASVALVVAGIGIMNIMLVSVTERMREIGVRLAVGARERDILAQFLLEAVTLSLLGGGLGLGLLGSYGIARFAQWRTLIRPDAILLAIGFAGAVGIFSGSYPALKASRLDPIQALNR